MKMKTRRAAVFASDGKYAIGVGITLIALEEKCAAQFDRYIIYYDNWSFDDIRCIESISDKVTLIRNDRETFLARNADLSAPMIRFMRRWGHHKYIFSDALRLLSEFESVVFMDADLVILKDISEALCGSSIAWRSGLLETHYKGVKLRRPNAGFIVFHDNIPYQSMADKYLDYCRDALGWDEIALARLVHDLGIEATSLDHKFNVTPATLYRISLTDIAVFHCTGKNKIWNSERFNHIFPEYLRYVDKYHDLRGTNSDKTLSRVKSLKQQFHLTSNISTLEKIKKQMPRYIDVRYTSLYEGRVSLRVKGVPPSALSYSFNHIDDETFRIRLSVKDATLAALVQEELEGSCAPYHCRIAANGSGTFYRSIKTTEIDQVGAMFSYFEKIPQLSELFIVNGMRAESNMRIFDKIKHHVPTYIDTRYTSLGEEWIKLRIKGYQKSGIHYSIREQVKDLIRVRLTVPKESLSNEICSDLRRNDVHYKLQRVRGRGCIFYQDFSLERVAEVEEMFNFFEKYIKPQPASRFRSVLQSTKSVLRRWA